jgi:hypothetical protein
MIKNKIYISGFVLMIAGFGAGILLFSILISGFAEQKSRSLLLFSTASEKLSRPVNGFYSNDINERIASYYSALEFDYISAEFLKKRYEEETQPAAKRTVLYVLRQKNQKMYENIKAKSDIADKKFRDIHERPYLF